MSARRLLSGVLGCAVLLACWELAGRTNLLGKTLPALSRVLAIYMQAPRRALLLRSASATLAAASLGFALGAFAAVAAAVAAHMLPPVRRGLDRLSVLVNALPVIALGPVLIITVGREATPAALASVPVFFLVYTSSSAGLRGASVRLQAVLRVLGATRWQRLVHLEAIAAVPSTVRGMKVATGSAMIGAIVGEWFGAPTGLGIVVLNSMQNFQIPLMWATVLVIATISFACYAALGLLEYAVQQRLR